MDESAELAHDLLASLEPAPADGPSEVVAAWNTSSTVAAVPPLNGTHPGTDWSTVRGSLREELSGT